MNVLVTKLQLRLVQGREKVGPLLLRLKVYGVTFCAPAITTRQGKQHGRQNKKAYRVNNYQ